MGQAKALLPFGPERLLQRVVRVLVYANNHYAGHGPATVRQLRELTEGDAAAAAPPPPEPAAP